MWRGVVLNASPHQVVLNANGRVSSVECLQHAATRCNTLHHTASHCNTLHHVECLQHTATDCITLQHTATRRVSIVECRVSRVECRVASGVALHAACSSSIYAPHVSCEACCSCILYRMLLIYRVGWCCGTIGAGSDYDCAMLGSRRNGTQCLVGARYGPTTHCYLLQVTMSPVRYGVCSVLPSTASTSVDHAGAGVRVS